MILENKLNITSQVELSRAEEKISKLKARQLFESGDIAKIKAGTFAGYLLSMPACSKISTTLPAKSAR